MSATTTKRIQVSSADFKREIVPDDCGDASYLEQEGLGFEDRLKAYRAGDFGFVGVRAAVEIQVPYSREYAQIPGATFITQTIRTPGLWSVESDSGEAYFEEIFQEECATLREMLAQLNVEVI